MDRTFNVVTGGLVNIEDMLSSEQVSELLAVSVSAVHRLAARGTLPSTFWSGRRMWKRETVNRYLADEAAQRRRRNGSKVTQGSLDLELDQAVEKMRREASQRAQAPFNGNLRDGVTL